MHTLRLLLSLSRHLVASSFFTFFYLPPSFSSPTSPSHLPSPSCLTCYPPSLALGTACMRRAGAPRPPRTPLAGGRARPVPWGAGRPRDAAVGAGAEAAGRGPRGLRASCGAGCWGLCYKNYVGAPCRGVTPPSLLSPRCSCVAADVFIYCFFPRLALLFGGSGRESR